MIVPFDQQEKYKGDDRMGIIIWVVVGAVLGFLANAVFNRDNAISNIIIGIVGSALAGWVATLFSVGAWNAFNIFNLLIAAAGACIAVGVSVKLLSK